MAWAVLTGSVLFSTTILGTRHARGSAGPSSPSTADRPPGPRRAPKVFVGVLTQTKMMSFSRMPRAMSVVKNRFRPQPLSDNLIEARLVDGRLVGIPGGDPARVDVDHRDPVVRALGCDDGHRRPAHVTGADAENALVVFHQCLPCFTRGLFVSPFSINRAR